MAIDTLTLTTNDGMHGGEALLAELIFNKVGFSLSTLLLTGPWLLSLDLLCENGSLCPISSHLRARPTPGPFSWHGESEAVLDYVLLFSCTVLSIKCSDPTNTAFF